jgi:hypothetical protein
MASIVVMASSTSSVSAMISAPSEMRCKSMPNTDISGNTMASVSGMDSATTEPARTPRATKDAAMMIRIACHRLSVKSVIASSTVTAWSATSTGSMPIGRSARMRSIAAVMLRPRARMSPDSRIEMASPIAGLPFTRNIGCGGVGGGAADLRDVAQAEDAVAHHEIDVADVLLGLERTGDTHGQALRVVLDHAGGAHQILRLQGLDQRGAVQPEAGEAFGGEFDEDTLILRAEDFDLRDVRHEQQAGPRILDIVAQLALREAIRGEAVDDAEGVAEIVDEEGAEDALRQGVADVRDTVCVPAATCRPRPPAA